MCKRESVLPSDLWNWNTRTRHRILAGRCENCCQEGVSRSCRLCSRSDFDAYARLIYAHLFWRARDICLPALIVPVADSPCLLETGTSTALPCAVCNITSCLSMQQQTFTNYWRGTIFRGLTRKFLNAAFLSKAADKLCKRKYTETGADEYMCIPSVSSLRENYFISTMAMRISLCLEVLRRVLD